jgi:uncharacterized membrane protein
MDDLTLARALYVLALMHWIGGVSMVTLVLLPARFIHSTKSLRDGPHAREGR